MSCVLEKRKTTTVGHHGRSRSQELQCIFLSSGRLVPGTVQLEWVNGRCCNFRANNSKTFLAYGVEVHKFWNNKREHGRCRGSLDFTTFTTDLQIVEPFGA